MAVIGHIQHLVGKAGGHGHLAPIDQKGLGPGKIRSAALTPGLAVVGVHGAAAQVQRIGKGRADLHDRILLGSAVAHCGQIYILVGGADIIAVQSAHEVLHIVSTQESVHGIPCDLLLIVGRPGICEKYQEKPQGDTGYQEQKQAIACPLALAADSAGHKQSGHAHQQQEDPARRRHSIVDHEAGGNIQNTQNREERTFLPAHRPGGGQHRDGCQDAQSSDDQRLHIVGSTVTPTDDAPAVGIVILPGEAV